MLMLRNAQESGGEGNLMAAARDNAQIPNLLLCPLLSHSLSFHSSSIPSRSILSIFYHFPKIRFLPSTSSFPHILLHPIYSHHAPASIIPRHPLTLKKTVI